MAHSPPKYPAMTPSELKMAIETESEQFKRALRWLEEHMPAHFLDEAPPKERMAIARSLLSFAEHDHFTQIQVQGIAFVLCLDGPDADVRILAHFGFAAIRYYRTFVSNEPPPFCHEKKNLRIATISFTDQRSEEKTAQSRKEEILKQCSEIPPDELDSLLHDLTPRFIRSLPDERLFMAVHMFCRAKTRDQCQYQIRKNEDWKSKESPSLQIVFAWRSVPKHRFLYRLAKLIHQHGLALKKVVAAYVDLYSPKSVLVLSIGLHGLKGKAAWEEADIDDFLREMCLLKYFDTEDELAPLVEKSLLSGNEAHLVRCMTRFIHQVLVYADPNLYSLANIQEGLCRHPELAQHLCKTFSAKFHPKKHHFDTFFTLRNQFLQLVDNLDTGQPTHDLRRKTILRQAINFIDNILKTNFYRYNKSTFAFRLDPKYLDNVPFDRKEKFPELPYGIFFLFGLHFIGFNIRFKDLARGGVRTVMPERFEQLTLERNTIFSEAYNLAYTQQKKNKDIPEGGAKTAILLDPFDVFAEEEEIYRREMQQSGVDAAILEEKMKSYRKDHKLEFLYSSQRCFIESFVSLVNCDSSGVLTTEDIVDYWKRPEYIYLGPDENMHNVMIEWIAAYAVSHHYLPGRSFMSSKPGAGINHKEYGVTSFGVNVYMEQILLFLGIDPTTQPFTVKISGGPDGDVAGNQILNLYKYYPKTAKLLALTDISGTIFDPNGLDLKEMADLCHKGLPIRDYPAEKLSDGGFLLDLRSKREQTAYAEQTLCKRKKEGKLIEDWLAGNEMNHLFRGNVHQVKADVFITGGGRPRTLNETNYKSFLDETGKPTSKAIVEGANLYLTPAARQALEKLGTLIIKDSSCNKGGVICSSFEVLGSLCLTEEEFIKEKPQYVKEVLDAIGKAARSEAKLLLSTFQATGKPMTEVSDQISERINLFKYQLLDHFETIDLPKDPKHFLIRCLLHYCPQLLQKHYEERILAMPELHKKAVIAVYIAARLVYNRGLQWTPTLANVLATLDGDPAF